MRRALFAMGYRYRIDLCREGTRIDIAFVNLKLAVFCDGCFWHGCPAHGTRAKHNSDYWDRKIAENVKRDCRLRSRLRRAGWKVIRVWEHDSLDRAIDRVARALDQRQAQARSFMQSIAFM